MEGYYHAVQLNGNVARHSTSRTFLTPKTLAMPHAKGPSKTLVFWTQATHRSPISAEVAEPYKLAS